MYNGLNLNENTTQASTLLNISHSWHNYVTAQCTDSPLATAINKTWLLTCAGLTLLIQVGYILYEAGSVRRKNAQLVYTKGILNLIAGLLAFWCVGFAQFAGNPWDYITGGQDLYAGKDWDQCSTYIYQASYFALFCFIWAVGQFSNSIWSGMMSERITWHASAIQSFIYMLVVWPFCAAWVWGEGYMYWRGTFDYAGSGVIHCAGAGAGIVGVLIIGVRYNRWNTYVPVMEMEEEQNVEVLTRTEYRQFTDEQERELRSKRAAATTTVSERLPTEGAGSDISPRIGGTSVPLLTFSRIEIENLRQTARIREEVRFDVSNLKSLILGTLFIWIGYFFLLSGFTWGMIVGGLNLWQTVEIAAVQCLIGGLAGGINGGLLRALLFRRVPNAESSRLVWAGICRGLIAGLASVAAGAPDYYPWTAFVCGTLAGWCYAIFSYVIYTTQFMDDATEGFAVHFGGGITGLWVQAFLDNRVGIIYNNVKDGIMLGLALFDGYIIFFWCAILAFCVFAPMHYIKRLNTLRNDPVTEIIGYEYMEYCPVELSQKEVVLTTVKSKEKKGSSGSSRGKKAKDLEEKELVKPEISEKDKDLEKGKGKSIKTTA